MHMDSEQIAFSWVEALFRLGAVIAHEGPTEVQRRILLHTTRGFNAASGSLALLQEDGETLVIVAGVDLPPHIIGHCIRRGEGIIGRVAASGEPLLLEGDITKKPKNRADVAERERPRPDTTKKKPQQHENHKNNKQTQKQPKKEASFS